MTLLSDDPRDRLDQLVVGVLLTLVGLGILIFHKSIKEWRDRKGARDFPFGYGEMWTGKYTRGGLIFTYVVIILFGVTFFWARVWRR